MVLSRLSQCFVQGFQVGEKKRAGWTDLSGYEAFIRTLYKKLVLALFFI